MSDVAIVGGGLAGLACARRLAEAGVDFVLVEATDRVGGRVRSDQCDGFTLDHGFQVLLTAYPACRHLLDYDALRLRYFDPGAMVWVNNQFHTVADPWRSPSKILATATAPVGSLWDKFLIAGLRARTTKGELTDIYQRTVDSTESYLKNFGFSQPMIDSFFRSFLGGVFLERELTTSSRMFEFVFRMFASGPIAIPADGMAAIPRQLADRLPSGSLALNSTVQHVEPTGAIQLSDGRKIESKQLVIATESVALKRLLGDYLSVDQLELANWNGTRCLYFASDVPPTTARSLMLCGNDRSGPVNNIVVISNVAPEYAPSGRSLISVSIVSEAPFSTHVSSMDQEFVAEEIAAVKPQLRKWFGNQVDGWRHLRTYHIPFALPQQTAQQLEPVVKTVEPWGSSGPVVCGDHRETSSIQGALNSGIRAAEAVMRRLGRGAIFESKHP